MDFIEQLQKEKIRLLGLVSSIDNLLSQYNSFSADFKSNIQNSFKSDTPSVVYNEPVYNSLSVVKKKLSLKDQVKEVVLNLKQFSKSSDIVEALFNLYPEKKKDEAAFKVQISGILSKLGSDGEIVKYQFSTSRKDAVWGKKEFLDENGMPKSEFLEWIL
ncbi:hypothetical protein [Mucilaginibacter sp. 22184]|uniref:hypothetical protein n=1 Tax=Mucilaginibacter sp. 22184 TaxID=3453887 RepID=UPI003F85EF17